MSPRRRSRPAAFSWARTTSLHLQPLEIGAPQHPTDLGMIVYDPVTAADAERIRSLMRERERQAR